MQLPSAKLGSDSMYELGLFHIAGVGMHPETAGLGPPFAKINDALHKAVLDRENAGYELVGARVKVRFSEYSAEHQIRSIASAAHQLDNNLNTGPAYKAVFPNLLAGELSPRGASQVEAGRALALRLSTQPAAAPLKEQFADKLNSALDLLETYVVERKQVAQKVAIARAVELGLREEWVTSYHHNAGIIKSLFPRNAERQDLYFDDFRRSSSQASSGDDPELTALLAADNASAPKP